LLLLGGNKEKIGYISSFHFLYLKLGEWNKFSSQEIKASLCLMQKAARLHTWTFMYGEGWRSSGHVADQDKGQTVIFNISFFFFFFVQAFNIHFLSPNKG
jgi:hypothetical protein